MKDWLGKVVGGEAEDLSRHDKWLSMMYPRLALLREMLSEDGSFWMSIDDNELHYARAILDEIFGMQNFVTTIIWEKIYAPKSSARHFSANHDYCVS
jgi:adenine-specific DNA-methyltransferase